MLFSIVGKFTICLSLKIHRVQCYAFFQVLSVLWDLELEEVEDILEEFVNKSLLFVDNNNKPFLYYLHDLQLDFLVEQNRTQLEVGLTGVIYSWCSFKQENKWNV